MNELDIIKEAVRVAPALAILVWVMLRQEKALKRVTDAYESQAKAASAALDRSTEMQGRTAAYLSRAADIIDDAVDEKRRAAK